MEEARCGPKDEMKNPREYATPSYTEIEKPPKSWVTFLDGAAPEREQDSQNNSPTVAGPSNEQPQNEPSINTDGPFYKDRTESQHKYSPASRGKIPTPGDYRGVLFSSQFP